MLALVDSWAMLMPFVVMTVVFTLLMIVLPVVFLWRALERAGLAAPLALLWFIPFGQIVVLAILAYSDWPNLRQA